MRRTRLIQLISSALALGIVSCGGTAETPSIVPSILVQSQSLNPANRVTIARVIAARQGFVSIQEDVAGQPGPVVGIKIMPVGVNDSVSVALDRDAVDGETFHAALHSDDGEIGVFEYDALSGLDPLVVVSGVAVVRPFVVTVRSTNIARVEVDDQMLVQANQVVVRTVVAAARGFIVIHEDDGGSIGGVIGVTSVPVGESTDVGVTLERDVLDVETLYAMLHIDDGQVGVYEFDGTSGLDRPVVDEDGAVIAPSFVATPPLSAPYVQVNDQTVSPTNRVQVARVISEGAGFIVIHEDNGGALGPVIGWAAVSGDVSAVSVTLQRDVRQGETLYAMLHTDTGRVGTYEFDGVNGLDLPARDRSGMVVAPPFDVTFEARVLVMDQTARPTDRVTVGEAVSVGVGFIVIHEDNAGSIGPVVGHTALRNGTNSNVSVTLDRHVVSGETLYAMLHTDTGAIGVYEFDGANGLDGPVVDGEGAVIAPPFVVDFEPGVTVDDQFADPRTEVVVREVTSDGPGFIVIHADSGGAPGPVLGNTAVDNGTTATVAVTLSRAVTQGERLYAMLHADTGVVGVYEFNGTNGFDLPVTDAGGNVITPPFDVSYFEVLVVNQTVSPTDRVVVDEVTYSGPGFIVIHQRTNGAPGAVLGYAAIVAGTNVDVAVTLDRSAVRGETLYAMLHTDTGVVGTYEFTGPGSPDGPVTLEGAVVTPSFTVTFTPSVAADDQTASPANQVVVASAVSDGPGWVVIYQQTTGAPGLIIGHAAVANGTNLDVAVTLDRDAVNGETLYAVLHTDTGVVGTYEYTGGAMDAPVTVNLMPVLDAFVVTR